MGVRERAIGRFPVALRPVVEHVIMPAIQASDFCDGEKVWKVILTSFFLSGSDLPEYGVEEEG